jgi:hypothetical protein
MPPAPQIDPTAKQIAKRAEQIRKTWTDRERLSRAGKLGIEWAPPTCHVPRPWEQQQGGEGGGHGE